MSYVMHMTPSPLDTVNKLTEAINKGDVETALSFYHDQAVLIAQPGNIARGKDAICTVLNGFVSLKPSLRGEVHQLVEAGDIALYCSRWILVGTSPEGKHVEMNGISSDVLCRQKDGQWLIAVDNPWGTSIVS
jgi:uncharacterized protein (TIGR02246 family)